MSILVSSNSSPILLESSRKDEALNSPTGNSSVVINNDSLLLSRYAATLHYLEENELKQVPALYHHETKEKNLHCIVGGSAVEEEDTESEDDDEDHLSSRGDALNEQQQQQERKTPPKSDVPIKSAASSFLNRVPLPSSISHPVLPPIQTYSPQLNLSLYSPCSTPISSIRSKKSRTCTNSALNSPSCLLDTSITVQNPTSNNLSSLNNRQKPLYSSTLTSSSSFASTIKMDIRSPPQPSQSTSRFMNAFQRFRSSSINQNNKNANNNSVAPAEIMSTTTTIKPSPSKSSLADKIKTKFHQQLDKKKRSTSLIDTTTRKNSVKNKNKNLSAAQKTSSTFSMPRSASISSITNWSSRLTANNNKSSSLPTTKMSTKQEQNRLSKSTSLTSFLSSRTAQSLKPSLSSSSSSSCSSSEAATTSLSSAVSPISNNGPLSLTKSISSHRLYKNTSTTDTRPRQPLRAVNPNDSVRFARHSFQSQQHQQRQKKKGGKTSSVVRFTKLVSVRETYSKSDYDRGSDPEAVCTRLTPAMAQHIKEELNAYKLHEMQVHEYSRVHTHFFL